MDNNNIFNQDEKSSKKAYEIGYGKPPKETQFKKGKSGNPAGRKKKIVPETILEALTLEITNKVQIINEKGKQENVPLFQVLVKQLIQDALKRQGSSRKLLFEILNRKNLLYEKQQLEEKIQKPKLSKAEEEKERMIRRKLLDKLDEYFREEDKKENL